MQLFNKLSSLILFLIVIVCHAVPNPDGSKRVIDKPLSTEQHYGENAAHNSEYDHEAFLGADEAKEFNQLTPEESKARLGKIVDKIDKDKDGFVTEHELKEWIKFTQKRYISDDVDRQWSAINKDKIDHLDWDSYKKLTYSFMEEERYEDDENDIKTYKEMMQRDKRRWEAADRNKDKKLSKDEFSDFLHPEEATHMHDIVIVETIEDIDKDGDGKISLQEYISDMYSGSEEDEPDWVKTEKEQFAAFRDKDGDGFMDKNEVKDWILPNEYDHSESESKHLMHEADDNKDKKLTKEEILNNYDLFVGSQATDFGDALTRHDEF